MHEPILRKIVDAILLTRLAYGEAGKSQNFKIIWLGSAKGRNN